MPAPDRESPGATSTAGQFGPTHQFHRWNEDLSAGVIKRCRNPPMRMFCSPAQLSLAGAVGRPQRHRVPLTRTRYSSCSRARPQLHAGVALARGGDSNGRVLPCPAMRGGTTRLTCYVTSLATVGVGDKQGTVLVHLAIRSYFSLILSTREIRCGQQRHLVYFPEYLVTRNTS